MTGRGATLALTIALCGCTAPEPAGRRAEPLIGGALERGHLGAVAIGQGGRAICSGSLVSPSVVLTAAHCIDGLAADPALTVYIGDDFEGEGLRVGVIAAQPHPAWTGELTGNHDLGLLLLAYPVDPALPLPLHREPPEVGDPIVRVGFGIHDLESGAQDGRKRSGTTAIHYVATSQDWYLAGDEALVACGGDSGGPALIEAGGALAIVGVHSFGFGCGSPDSGDTRVDLYASSFIDAWIEAHDPTCGADGTCAPVGCPADPDCEPCGADGTCVDGCLLPDVDCPTQPLGAICRADSQCESGLCLAWREQPGTRFCSRPCQSSAGDCPEDMRCRDLPPLGEVCDYEGEPPGALGAACDRATDCASYQCEGGVCVTPCDLSVGLGCPPGFACAAAADERHLCRTVPAEPAGCALASRDPGAGALVLLATIAARARRRRSRSL